MTPNTYGVFLTYAEDEGNIVSELIAITNNIIDAKKIIHDNIKMIDNYRRMTIFNTNMNENNDYTHVGKRTDIPSSFHAGFIIELLEINKFCPTTNCYY